MSGALTVLCLPQPSLEEPLLNNAARNGKEEYAVAEVEIPSCAEDETGSPAEIKFSWHKLWLFAGPGWLMSVIRPLICLSDLFVTIN